MPVEHGVTTTNTNLELIAEAFSYGTEAITTNADTHTTTIADGASDPGRALYLKYTGTLDSACTITIGPNTVSKVWIVENGTSGSQNIILSQGSGANITIPAGDTKVVYSDGAGAGAAFFDAFASLSVVDLKVQDDLTVTGDITGTLATAAQPNITSLGTIASLVATTADINGGTVDGTVIGGTTAAAISGTTGTFSSTLGVTGIATFTTAIKGNRDIASFGANTGSSANRMALSMEGAGVSRLISNGADASTKGTFEVFNATSGGTGAVGLELNALNGLIITPLAGGHAVFNEGSVDADFRVESDTNAHAFYVDGTNGNVGIGTNADYGDRLTVVPATTITTVAAAKQIQIGESSGNTSYRMQLGYYADPVSSWQSSIQSIAGGNPAGLVLNGDGGNVLVGATSGSNHIISKSVASGGVLEIINTSATSPSGTAFKFTGAAPNNGTSTFFATSDTSAYRGGWLSNGGVQNYQGNNSNLSDEREKKNIEDLSSTWDCVKSWNLRKFHYNEDEDSDDKRLGVIAQEVEVECPEVITEWKKQEQKDEVLWTEEDELPEGVSVGDVKTAAQEEIMRKGVKEQQLYWMAIKALQEAMTEIEDLKARITTLENA
jgi:hypothetical protein